jgi:predicted RNase H-like HicB family nuclease
VRNEFTAIIEKSDGWFIASSPELPAANGQGRTREEALTSLAAAIELVLEDLREDALAALPPGAERTVVAVG